MRDVLRFCEIYNEKKRGDSTRSIEFTLCYQRVDPDLTFRNFSLALDQIPLIQLDNDDTEYLYKKYFPTLENQKQDEINEIEKKYNEVLNKNV